MNYSVRRILSATLLFVIAVPLATATTKHTRKPLTRRRTEQRSIAKARVDHRAAARRRAEAARQAALVRQRAAEEAMRRQVQSMIANDNTFGEDPEIRRIAVNALGDHAGTVVVMDPKTGRVYSIVNQQWALREGFKPCSTIKLVTGLAGLNEHVIDSTDAAAISDSNRVTLTSALAHSKNEYFQTVGGRIGFDKMISYARRLGLGEKTGINFRDESAGRLPKYKAGFAVNHMSSHGDDFKVTAVQLATLISTMANGGKLLKPFVARDSGQISSPSPKVRRLLNIQPDSFSNMLPGMIGSVNYGSGRRAFDPLETIAGKTGTCTDHREWVGLFASYAPVKDPKLAVVVIARGDDGRNHFPAAVAGRIYRDLRQRFAPTDNDIAATRPIPTISSAAEEDNDEEEADASDDESANDGNSAETTQPRKTVLGIQPKSAGSKVKLTLMALPNRSAQTGNISSTGAKPRRTSRQK